MNAVSAVIITYNEADNLRRSLPKLTWCDEIIVIDSLSTDDTKEVCKQFNCRFYEKKFEGYGEQKRFGVSLAINKWVLCPDADEVLSDELAEEIKTEMESPLAAAYLIPITFVFMGKKFKYGKDSWRYFLRLFNKDLGNFNDNIVHEKIIIEGKIKKFKHNILHYSYMNIEHYFNKFNKFSSLGAKIAYENGKRRSLLLTVFAVPLYFLKYYLLELNFLNGVSGFYWSMFSSFYHFVKYSKIREMYSNKKNNNSE